MLLLDNEHDEAQQHLQMDEPSKMDSDSSEEKGLAIDEDIINDDAETNIIEQSQVKERFDHVIFCSLNFLFLL